MYSPTLSHFLENCSPSLPLLCLVLPRSILTFDLSVIKGGDKFHVKYQRFARAKMRANSH
jgi:hypothetical protein